MTDRVVTGSVLAVTRTRGHRVETITSEVCIYRATQGV